MLNDIISGNETPSTSRRVPYREMARRRLNTWHGAGSLTEDVCWLGPAERPPRIAQGGREQTARENESEKGGWKGK